MDAPSAQAALVQVAIKAIKLADPEAWDDMNHEAEGQRLKDILVSLVTVINLRGHSAEQLFAGVAEDSGSNASQLLAEAAHEDAINDVWVDPQPEEGDEEEDEEKENNEVVVVAPVVSDQESATSAVAAAPAPAPVPAPVLHPSYMVKYNYDWRPVHTGPKKGQYVLTEVSGRMVYKSEMSPATCCTLKPVAPLPPAADILALKARPSGTFLQKGGQFHAVFLGPRGGRFVIVGGAKKWARKGEPVRLLVTEHDRAAMGAAAEE
jgi:hypothetical protein